RILAAQALLAAKQWSSAYYLAGFAVEFGLKSCILVHVAKNVGVIFDDRRFSDRCFSHSIKDLLKLAGLEDVHDVDTQWNEKSRYQTKTRVEAEELFNAIVDQANGVMQWIRHRW
ncbi:MAG: hypothetical protein HYR84_09885, partial [Planctomycetes bacterium]|nr:hypothetical protein [Planctomycetota bacterium]